MNVWSPKRERWLSRRWGAIVWTWLNSPMYMMPWPAGLSANHMFCIPKEREGLFFPITPQGVRYRYTDAFANSFLIPEFHHALWTHLTLSKGILNVVHNKTSLMWHNLLLSNLPRCIVKLESDAIWRHAWLKQTALSAWKLVEAAYRHNIYEDALECTTNVICNCKNINCERNLTMSYNQAPCYNRDVSVHVDLRVPTLR